RQPGALGTLIVDAGDNRWITINLWQSQEQAMAALAGLVPEVQHVVEPLLAAPSQLVGAGPVRLNTMRPSVPDSSEALGRPAPTRRLGSGDGADCVRHSWSVSEGLGMHAGNV